MNQNYNKLKPKLKWNGIQVREMLVISTIVRVACKPETNYKCFEVVFMSAEKEKKKN